MVTGWRCTVAGRTGDGGAPARHRNAHAMARRAAAGSHETPTRDRARAFQNSKLSAFLRALPARAHTCDSRSERQA